ncbi:unnamed protein product [Meloidogyne enterolobii]|uniref:Uncharacterized protein n=1 Tax=Meloidogyne enterolobii TaxID=390850 RepID=A0ACB0YWH8_MELEN
MEGLIFEKSKKKIGDGFEREAERNLWKLGTVMMRIGSEKIWEEGLGDLGQGIGEHAKNDSQRGLMGRGSIKGIKRVH